MSLAPDVPMDLTCRSELEALAVLDDPALGPDWFRLRLVAGAMLASPVFVAGVFGAVIHLAAHPPFLTGRWYNVLCYAFAGLSAVLAAATTALGPAVWRATVRAARRPASAMSPRDWMWAGTAHRVALLVLAEGPAALGLALFVLGRSWPWLLGLTALTMATQALHFPTSARLARLIATQSAAR